MCEDCVRDGVRRFDEDGKPICYLCGASITVRTYIDAGHAMSHTDCFTAPDDFLVEELAKRR